MIRVGVIGANGRMGREVCRAVSQDPDMSLVGAIDRSHAGEPAIAGSAGSAVTVSADLQTLLQA